MKGQGILLVSFALYYYLCAEESIWAVGFTDSEPTQPINFAREHNLKPLGKAGWLENVFLFQAKDSPKRAESIRRLQALTSSEQGIGLVLCDSDVSVPGANYSAVLWLEEQHPVVFEKRALLPFRDPLLPGQWHLHNQTSHSSHIHINVLPAWDRGITGKGVVIAFIDDGVEHDHPDLTHNWLPGPNNWPRNMLEDYHGTSVAGLAVAYYDGETCGVGVAPDAHFSSIVLLQHSSSTFVPSTAAQALTHSYDINDIYCWGPRDDGLRKEGPNALITRSLLTAIEKGRGGLGSLYMWAAGNGRQNGDNCNYDGYANSRYVVTVGAVTDKGTFASYSEPCSALIGVLPSGSGGAPLRTTDLHGNYGLNSAQGSAGACTERFAASASSPLAAGIAALMLEANPNLTWLDFQYVLKMSTIKTDPKHRGWILNGGGVWVSHEYGFGIIDAYLAVKRASSFNLHVTEIALSFPSDIPESLVARKVDGIKQYSIESRIPVNQTILLHHVEAVVTITHKIRGQLDIRLTSPYGTQSIFATPHRDTNANYTAWRFTTLFAWGELSYGNWTLSIIDGTGTPDESAVLESWTLNLYGIDPTDESYPDFVKRGASNSFEWDLDGVSSVETPNTNTTSDGLFYSLFGEGHEAVMKVVLMIGLVCGIFITVVTMIIVVMLKRDVGLKVETLTDLDENGDKDGNAVELEVIEEGAETKVEVDNAEKKKRESKKEESEKERKDTRREHKKKLLPVIGSVNTNRESILAKRKAYSTSTENWNPSRRTKKTVMKEKDRAQMPTTNTKVAIVT